MKSIVIIGKGTSCLNSTKDFVDSHDEVAIINKVIFNDNYKKLISEKADIQFCNGSIDYYDEISINKLNIKKMIFTGKRDQTWSGIPLYYNKIEKIYPKANLGESIIKEHNFDPSSGIMSLYYLINSELYSEISMIGFDFYELNTQPYYHSIDESGYSLRRTINMAYRNYKINVPSKHNMEKSIEFCHYVFKKHNEVKFNLISNNNKFLNINLENVNII